MQLCGHWAKEALAKRKQDGHTLGRPKGKAEKVKLDAREAEILGYLEKQVSKAGDRQDHRLRPLHAL